MGNGAMLGKLRSPRPHFTLRSPRRQCSESMPVVGRACDDAGSCIDANTDVEAGVARFQCTRCSATRALPYGTVAFTCSACSSDVRVSLHTMSMSAKAGARMHLQKAGRVVCTALEDQTTSCKQLWEGLKRCFADEDAAWDQRRRCSDAANARELVRAALSSHDLGHAAETLSRWDALGLPLASENISSALATLRHEDELASLWQRVALALEAADHVDLELWCDDAAAKDLCVPVEVKAAIQALHGQERAMRAEDEYQVKLKARVAEARLRDDAGALKALGMEVRLLGEDPSVVDAVVAPAKSYRRKRCPSNEPATTAPQPKMSGIREIKEELAKRGISSVGALDKEELLNLLARGRSSVYEASDAARNYTTYGEVPLHRPPSTPLTPKGAHVDASGALPNSKPPIGPRSRTSSKPNHAPVPPGMPSVGEDAASQRSRPASASAKPSTYDDDALGGFEAAASERSARPWSAFMQPTPSDNGGESRPSQRRPSPASAFVRGLPVPSGPASVRGTPMPGGCEPSQNRPSRPSSARAAGPGPSLAQGCGIFEAGNSQQRASSASARSTAPDVCEPPSMSRPNRPSSASRAARPPSYAPPTFADMRAPEPENLPRPARFTSASPRPQAEGPAEMPQRRPSSASFRGRAGRPSSASRPAPSSGEAPTGGDSSTPQRPARPSSVPRAPSSNDVGSPPPHGSPSSPWQRGFSASPPRTGEQRPSKRNFFMPPRAPAQSPRPSTPPRASAPPRSARAATPVREAALQCLGLKGNPTGDEIRRAYKQAALQCHPDRPQNHGCAEEAKANFQQVKEAFDSLKGPERRSLAAAAGG